MKKATTSYNLLWIRKWLTQNKQFKSKSGEKKGFKK